MAKKKDAVIDLQLPNCHGAGVEARYWRLGADMGMKVYNSRAVRDTAYNAQRKLAKAGYAPRLAGRFTARLNGEMVYGLITEHVPKMGHQLSGAECNRAHAILDKAVWSVFGRHWADNHAGNYGLLADGTPVVVDFGSHSFDDKDGAKGEAPCTAEVHFTCKGGFPQWLSMAVMIGTQVRAQQEGR